jgi:peptidoglycan/LPS O-acetylase OafA/YrhL
MTSKTYGVLADGWHALLYPGKRQILALDGLRAIAILLVIATHTSSEFLDSGGAPTSLGRFPLVQGGWIGVDLFFVLSGFFIGGQLWKEHQAGTVSICQFVIRRGLRIWPLYFWIVAIALGFGLRPWSPAPWPDLLFLSNYFGERVVLGGWSLSTEEQFYLCVPVVVWIGVHRRWSLLSFRWLLIGLMALECVVRAWVWSAHVGLGVRDNNMEVELLYTRFHTHCDGLLAGLFVSNLFADPATRHLFSHRLIVLIVPVAAVFAIAIRHVQHAVFGYSALAVVFGALVGACAGRQTFWTRVFEVRVLHVIARLSFGMYLNYRFLLPSFAQALNPWRLPGSSASLASLYALTVSASGVLAAVTFIFVERPFLRVRGEVLRRFTSGRRDQDASRT